MVNKIVELLGHTEVVQTVVDTLDGRRKMRQAWEHSLPYITQNLFSTYP